MEERESKVWLLWAKRSSVLFSYLSGNILREICSYLDPMYLLVSVSKLNFSYFDFATFSMQPAIQMNTPITQDVNSRWTVVDYQRVLLCGGGIGGEAYTEYEAFQSAYMLHTSGTVQVLAGMLSGHRSCGVQVWRGAVHVFGSFVDEGATKSECMHLRDLAWTALPDMHSPRSCFTPAVWRSALYLCGGIENDTIEIWDGHCMTIWNIKLPAADTTSSCVQGGQLLLLFRESLVILSEPAAGCPAMVVKRHSLRLMNFNPSPVLYKDAIYYFCDKDVRKLSLITDIY